MHILSWHVGIVVKSHGGTYGQEKIEEQNEIGILDESSIHSYSYYKYMNIIRKDDEIILFKKNFGSFCIGHRCCNQNFIEEIIKSSKYDMLDEKLLPMRCVYDRTDKEYIIYVYDDCYHNENLYVLKEDKLECKEADAGSVDCMMYRDGGTTDINYKIDGKGMHLHIDSPLKDNVVNTLNNIQCVNVLQTNSEDMYKLYDLFYKITGKKLVKND